MVFVAYYDASGKSDQPCTTLTGIAAPESLWRKFEPLWLDALDRNEVPDHDFHMTDLMSDHGGFKGWGDDRKRRRLLTDLFNVLGQFRGLDFSAYSCTVVYDAYNIAKSKLPHLPKPEAICVDYCVGGLQLTQEQLQSEQRPILLYFDRNEACINTVKRVWQQKNKTGWQRQVRDIDVKDRSECSPIRAADMLGWIVNRYRRDAAAQQKPQPIQHWPFDQDLEGLDG